MHRPQKFFIAWILLFGWLSAAHAKSCPESPAVVQPVIIGFSGWTPPVIGRQGSAMEDVINRFTAQGLTAEAFPPNTWPEVAKRLVAHSTPESSIVLIGYSMGAAAAIHVAQMLGSVGIPVKKLVVIEAWNPEPIPRNVNEATHYYSTTFADHIVAGPGNDATVKNVDLKRLVPGLDGASHVGMSQIAAVQDFIVDRVGDGMGQASAMKKPKKKTSCKGTKKATF